jgi:hypothetical protein
MRESNEKKKENRREGRGMGNKGSTLLAFPLPPSYPYFLLHSHSQWVFWPREEEAEKDMKAL